MLLLLCTGVDGREEETWRGGHQVEEQSVGPPGRSDSMASPEGKKVREKIKRRRGGEIKRVEALKNTSIFTAYVVSGEALFWLLLNKRKTFHKEKGNGFFLGAKRAGVKKMFQSVRSNGGHFRYFLTLLPPAVSSTSLSLSRRLIYGKIEQPAKDGSRNEHSRRVWV